MAEPRKKWVPRWQVEWRVGALGGGGQRRTKYFPDTADGALDAMKYADKMKKAGHTKVRAREPIGHDNSTTEINHPRRRTDG